MHDLTTIYYWHCITYETWERTVEGSKGATYKVRWNNYSHKNRGSVQYDFSCSCPSYKFGKGYCKHIKQAQEKWCGWSQFSDGGDVVKKEKMKDYKCPKCGSEVKSMGWGV